MSLLLRIYSEVLNCQYCVITAFAIHFHKKGVQGIIIVYLRGQSLRGSGHQPGHHEC